MSIEQQAIAREDSIQELIGAAEYARIVRDAAENRLRRAVCTAVAAGLSQRQIAAALGCRQPEVHRILRRAQAQVVVPPPPPPQAAKPRRRSRARFASSSPMGKLLIANRDTVLEIAERHHATTVKVFGSVARGEDDGRSDIDLLADFTGTNPLDQVAMAREIQDLLGVPVDVGSADALRPHLRKEVLNEAIPL